jgi:hypothetical protein
MPLVFTQNEVSVAEIDYADVLGKVYEYPPRYRTLIQPGERFVYYRGRRRADGSSQTPSYLGCGTVGKITEIGERLRCTVVDYQEFKHPVLFKVCDIYREPDANQRKAIGFYFQVGVRSIDQRAFDKILAAGLGRTATKKAALEPARKASTPRSDTSSSDNVYALALALALATAEAKAQWPSAKIFRAPAGQYFSLIVRHPNGENHHIAIKSTEEPEPLIRISNGEVAYAETHAPAFSLWVFYGIDLLTGTAKLIRRRGRITEADIDLRSAIHGGRLKNVKASKKVGPIPG